MGNEQLTAHITASLYGAASVIELLLPDTLLIFILCNPLIKPRIHDQIRTQAQKLRQCQLKTSAIKRPYLTDAHRFNGQASMAAGRGAIELSPGRHWWRRRRLGRRGHLSLYWAALLLCTRRRGPGAGHVPIAGQHVGAGASLTFGLLALVGVPNKQPAEQAWIQIHGGFLGVPVLWDLAILSVQFASATAAAAT